MANQLRALVLGSTGAMGSEIVRQCLADSRFAQVTAISRRPLDCRDAKLRVVIPIQFGDFSPHASDFGRIDTCFCALGISQSEEKDPFRYRQITHDYVLAAAETVHRESSTASFVFVSSMGVTPEMKSRFKWARVKGETEKDLRALLGDKLIVIRPGYVYPVAGRHKKLLIDRVIMPIFPLMQWLLPGATTTTVEVAHAMMYAAIYGGVPPVWENRDIRRIASMWRAGGPGHAT